MSVAVEAPEVRRNIDFFRNVPIFGGVPDCELVRVCTYADWRRYEAGEVVVREGELAKAMFVVLEGRVAVRKGPEERQLCELSSGDCFGEMAIIDIQPRSATVVATESAVLMALGFDDLCRIQQSNLETFTLIVLNVAREISRRLRATNELVAELGIDPSRLP